MASDVTGAEEHKFDNAEMIEENEKAALTLTLICEEIPTILPCIQGSWLIFTLESPITKHPVIENQNHSAELVLLTK